MRAIAAAALLLVVGCGQTGGPGVAGVSSSPDARAVASSTRLTPTTPPGAAVPVKLTDSYGVIVDLNTGPEYTLSLVASDGRLAAQARARIRSVSHDAGVAELPYVSITSDRVYYLDGDSQVKWIDPIGGTGTGPQLPGSQSTPVAFAVSPDDTRIAVSKFTLSLSPPLVQLYTDSITGGSEYYIFKSYANDYIWPVGWHEGLIVLAAQTFLPIPGRVRSPGTPTTRWPTTS